jgi:hypothetical protein
MSAVRRSFVGANRRLRGQAALEYLVVAGLAVALLALPMDGHASVAALLLDALRTGYARFLAAISLAQ